MTPYKHQIELFKKGLGIIREHMIVYLACEERTGKTLPSIMIAEEIKAVERVLVLTKKRAIDGWTNTLSQYQHANVYRVTNYQQAHKLKDNYDLIILDEAHSFLSAFPNPSKTWAMVKKLCVRKPIIYLSATPFAQGYQLLYHQLALSSWSPWARFKTGKHWFMTWGVPNSIYIKQRLVQVYTETKPQCFEEVKHLFITLTREEIGFAFEPKDKLHYVELSEKTKDVYNYLLKKKALVINNEDLIADTVAKLRAALHSLEGGTVIISKEDNGKMKRNYVVLGNNEKVDYIKDKFGDHLGMVIMYHYKAEKLKLERHFKMAQILQATSYAEGVDLSMYDHLIIYSQDWSTAKHTQRRARQANKLRGTEIVVHYLLVKDAISSEVYETVSINKKNYVDKMFQRRELS